MVHERHWKGTLVWSNSGRRNLPNRRTCFPFNIHSDEDVRGMCSHSELYMGNNFLPSPLTWCFLVVTLNRPDEWEDCVYLVPFDESEFSLINLLFLLYWSTWLLLYWSMGFPGEESACSSRDLGLIPESGRCPGEGNGNPPQYSCLENSMDRRALQAIFHGGLKSQTRLSDIHTYWSVLI